MSERAAVRDMPPVETATRRWPVLAACMMAVFMAAVESTIVATAMPTIVADLGGFHLFSWVFAVYLLTLSVTIPVYGRLSDLYGRRRVFYAGAGLFLVGSTLCGFARGMPALVAFRALQGLGAGAVQPIATTIVGDIYAPAERARVQGWISAVWGVAAIIGPALGAFLVERVTWSAVFWVNLPVGAAAMAMFALFLRERPRRREHKIDYLGSLLLMTGAGALMLAVVELGTIGGAGMAGLVAVALVALGWLALHERGAAEPMFPLELWRSRVIVLANLGGFGIGAVMMGVSAFLPTYVQGVMGRSAEAAGFVLANMSVSWTFASIAAGRLMVRRSYRASAIVGGFALVAGMAVLVALGPARGPLWAGASAFLIGIGMGFSNTSFLVSTQASVGWHIRGLATASLLFMRMVGQALGAAVFGAVLNLGLYRRLPDAGDAIDRLMEPALRQSLGAAEIDRLTGAIAASLHSVWLLGGVLALATLVLALALPPGLSPTRPAEPRNGRSIG